MTIGELKKALEEFNDDTLIVLSSDGEGNSYSPLAGIDTLVYQPTSTWGGDALYIEETIGELEEEGFGHNPTETYDEFVCRYLNTTYDYADDEKPIVVLTLWPTN